LLQFIQEFDLHAEQGIQHNPPIELFSQVNLFFHLSTFIS
jgi:hypothetical protein